MLSHASWLGVAALALAAVAALLLVGFLVRRPAISGSVKLHLFFVMFVLPTSAAVLGNAANLETTKRIEFCGSCHVMETYVGDVRDPDSRSLAAVHGQLEIFRDEACYTCHADYGMLGGVTTKIGGMHHVYDYYTKDWDAPGHRGPALYKPYDTRRCTSCHEPLGKAAPLEHKVHEEEMRANAIGCSSDGCHGPPHPVKFVPRGDR
jgi:cytochrome c-type protein NapC